MGSARAGAPAEPLQARGGGSTMDIVAMCPRLPCVHWRVSKCPRTCFVSAGSRMACGVLPDAIAMGTRRRHCPFWEPRCGCPHLHMLSTRVLHSITRALCLGIKLFFPRATVPIAGDGSRPHAGTVANAFCVATPCEMTLGPYWADVVMQIRDARMLQGYLEVPPPYPWVP